MKKDFLCIDYSWVPNSRFIFMKLSERFSCDIVDEKTLDNFPYAEDYSNIILYLHEPHTISKTNKIIDRYKNAKLIQHDDTDFEDIQIWTTKKPDLIFQRELTLKSKNPWGSTVVPHHFPIFSMKEDFGDKQYDVFFMGTLTNTRRLPFIQKIVELQKTTLNHLKWKLMLTPADHRTPKEYKKSINQSKIGLHSPGNSFDSWRIWELASCGLCTIMPKLPLLSVGDGYMPYNSYVEIRDDYSDLEEKILYCLESERWKDIGESNLLEYTNDHTPEKCFLHYLKMLKNHIL